MTEWVNKWKRNGWQTTQAEPVKNKEDIIQLDTACQKIDVKWVSGLPLIAGYMCTSVIVSSMEVPACYIYIEARLP